ncbi:hypothetical protein [Actinophytocola sp.]|jgi:hypothetical protein|uniref:hypothetical protein n=1 Tax=Actinophytocola sp. TaxID=1872138 RepID=UPI002D80FEB3|nr:hypothetical protein [Actinophytocola sp.]HET9142090.1 hypothetical protein [Actinophytocola sp.]
MKVFLTLSAALRLAFWLFVLGMALGLLLRVQAAGEPQHNDPATSPVDVRVMSAPSYSSAEGGC